MEKYLHMQNGHARLILVAVQRCGLIDRKPMIGLSEDTICCTSPQLAEESPPSARRQSTGRDQFSGSA
jgi:hypothetical protein